ncbi:DNA repair protein RecO [Patescibacteria group bacterium]|nr:DNA repair protein RecO [Patescibacteria group bacterium]MBU4600508.1 DNA repair protein RecO [Patescibacteria group bacterium]MCG2697658.1 DNA repair protein RecO [Candidatus Parcubacteria bacterium]
MRDETYTTKAIILNRQPFRENDSRITLYGGEEGKLELVARGARKITSKLAAHLEPINLSEVMVVRGRQFDYIGGAVSQNCHANLKSDLEKLLIAGQAINIFNKLIKRGEGDGKIFILLQDFLNILDKDKEFNCELLLDFFILKLLVRLGYRPELHNCVVCKNKIKPTGNKFDLSKGGLVCADCASPPPALPAQAWRAGLTPLLIRKGGGDPASAGKTGERLPISENCIKVLRFAIINNLDKPIKLKIDNKLTREINNIVNLFLNYHSL